MTQLSLNKSNISFDDPQKMGVLGIGTDICHVNRIETLYNRFKDKFLVRIFSSQECLVFKHLADTQKISFLAKRFAVKEAVAKALQTGIGEYAYFTDISCLNHQNQAPKIILTGKTHETALRLAQNNDYSNYHIHVSISDETEYAVAFIILTGITELR